MKGIRPDNVKFYTNKYQRKTVGRNFKYNIVHIFQGKLSIDIVEVSKLANTFLLYYFKVGAYWKSHWKTFNFNSMPWNYQKGEKAKKTVRKKPTSQSKHLKPILIKNRTKSKHLNIKWKTVFSSRSWGQWVNPKENFRTFRTLKTHITIAHFADGKPGYILPFLLTRN